MSNSTHKYGTTSALTKNEFTRTGYSFKGWSVSSSSSTVTYADQGNVTKATSTANGIYDLYAVWTANEYTVNYETGTSTGGTLPTNQPATYNESITLGTNSMTKSNTNLGTVTFNYNGSGAANTTSTAYTKYTANGWTTTSGSTTRNYTNGQAFTYTLTSDLTLYPCFTQTKVSATFPSPSPTRTGYTFDGWYTAASGGSKVTSYTGTSNVTYYAHWTGNTYYIKYNANGGTGTMANSTHIYGTASPLTANAFKRTGYSFGGWSVSSSSSTVTYADKGNVTRATSTANGVYNLYAVWNINSYTLTFNANGGSVSPTSITQDYGTSLTLPTPTRSGYNFLGWYTAASGGTKRTYTTMPAVSEPLYAQWEEIKTLTFSNGTTVSLSNVTGGSAYTMVTLPAGATIYYKYTHSPSGAAGGETVIYSGQTYGTPNFTTDLKAQAYGATGSYTYTTTDEDTIALIIRGIRPGSNDACFEAGGTNCATGTYSGSLTVTKITDANGNEYDFE